MTPRKIHGLRWLIISLVMLGSVINYLTRATLSAAVPGTPNFTGAFVGMACQDMAGTVHPADFDWFEYRERDYCTGFAA